MSYQYSVAQIICVWNGIDLSEGAGEDSWIEVIPNSPLYEAKSGVGGRRTRSKIADQSATINITLDQCSPANHDIAKVAGGLSLLNAPRVLSNMVIKDKVGGSALMVLNDVELMTKPTMAFNKTSGEYVWSFDAELAVYGDDPDSITKAANSFIK